ncbi:hypothetical protein [Kaistella sp.]|uniref:hypothetical protein n=1 Tax=Kaistella sp. TaxID=2782235 RepID=UPI003C4A3DC3
MSIFLSAKKRLVFEVFEKAKKETTETAFSAILKDLENTLRDDFRIQLSYKTFETYYKFLVEKNEDYNIKPVILDDLSHYLGEKDFKDFCAKRSLADIPSNIKVNINGNEEILQTNKISEIIINITNSPIFTLPEFVSKHSQSFGIIGVLLGTGFFLQKNNYFNNKIEESKPKIDSQIIPIPTEKVAQYPIESIQKIVHIPQQPKEVATAKNVLQKKEKECMYWNNEEYIPIYCDEIISDHHVEQRKDDLMKLRKITRPDTLTEQNALGKVWYAKTNKKVEFFTHYGINPTTGKTLKEVSKYILDKYKNE